MADNKKKIDFKEKQPDFRLYNVKTITSLPDIGEEISDKVLNSSYAVFAYDSENNERYVSHKVRFSKIMDEAFNRSWAYIDVLKDELTYFMENLWIKSNPTYLNIVKRPIEDDFSSWTDKRLGYDFTITPQFSYLQMEEDSYIVSYIPTHDSAGNPIEGGGTYTYLYSYTLSDGLINHTVLQEYIDKTLDRILGVPNTEEAREQAINSVQEFIDWFASYVTSDENYGSLQHLINTIERKDEYIRQLSYDYSDYNKELSYNYTDYIKDLAYDYTSSQLNTQIGDLDFKHDAVASYYLTGIEQVDGKIVNVSYSQVEEGNHIDIDYDHNTLNIGGVQYSLDIDANGKLGFSQYNNLTLTVSGGGDLEIDSTPSSSNLLFKVTANNNITTATWNGTETATTSGKTTQITISYNGNTSITRHCVVNDGTMEQTSNDIVLKFTKYRYFLGWSTNPNLTFSNSNLSHNINNTSNYNNFKNSLSTSDIYKKGFSCGTDGYWYFITPVQLTIENIYFGAGTGKAPAAGGWHKHKLNWTEGETVTDSQQITVTQYSTNHKYYIYRSNNPFSGEMNIQF